MSATVPQTPLMRQYSEIKRRHPDALLLFRLGDFYELFYDDAVTAARELEITLTARNKEKGAPVPMCGVPYHAADAYVARLLQKGFRVALCDQMEDPAAARGLVRREVTRVLTPGTSGFHLPAGDNNYLAAVARGGESGVPAIGLALLDVSTGEFRATEFTGAEAGARLGEELARWAPREILHAAEAPLFRERRPEELGPATLTPLEEWTFTPEFGREVLESHFGVLSLEGYGLADRPWAAAAAGALVHYVKETQRSSLAHVDRLGFFERRQALVLDASTVRNLELVEPLFPAPQPATLRAVIDESATPMGKRLLRQWLLRPAADRGEIEARLAVVDALHAAAAVRDGLRALLGGVQDLERLLARVSLETAGPRDVLGLKASLDRLPDLGRQTAALPAMPARLRDLIGRIDPLTALREHIAATLVDDPPAVLGEGGVIRAGVSPELDELRALGHGARGAVAAIEARERTRTGIASLKVRFNGIFGYYIEISKANLRRVQPDYERKQTLVNAERFTTPELKELETKIRSADERGAALERALFAALRAACVAAAGPIRGNAAAVAELDVLAGFAHLATRYGYARPEIVAADAPQELEIRAGRHPVVERLGWEGRADRFVPNDVFLDPTRRILIITGPNMGGKSTYLRQTALIAILAHMGSFVPAERARLPLLDRIFTRIGAGDNLARGRSTFMVEMTEAAAILNQAGAQSLVILDELGRGTATYDGLALAWAMIEYLHGRVGAKALFATHYHELTGLAHYLPAVANLHVSARESGQGIVFLRKVEPGEASRSYGIEVARLAGLPPEVIERARAVLAIHERAGHRAEEQLETPAAPAGGVQLTMFTPLDARIAAEVAAADLDRLTPIEALNLLAKLQQDIKNGP